MPQTADETISIVLDHLRKAENGDHLFIIAATLNLHRESLRRIKGHVLYTPEDVKRLFELIAGLIDVPTSPMREAFEKGARPVAPNAGETQETLAAGTTNK